MASPASNHATALLASDCQSCSSECAWFVMSGSCGLPTFFKALTGTPLICVAHRFSFGTAGSNFLLPLDFLTRTAVADSLLLFRSADIFATHLSRLSSAHGGILSPARAIVLLVCPHTRLPATRVLSFRLFLAFNIHDVIDDGLLALGLVRSASGQLGFRAGATRLRRTADGCVLMRALVFGFLFRHLLA